MLSQKRSALLTHAISEFNPEVFVHPVWIRFGEKELSTSLKTTDNLLSDAKNLQNDDPIGACQIPALRCISKLRWSKSQRLDDCSKCPGSGQAQ